MTTYGLGWLFWALNYFFDNEGGILDFVTTVYYLAVNTVMAVTAGILSIWSFGSYGSQAQVLTSWSGSSTYASLGTNIPNAPDNFYLMWKEGSQASGSTVSLKDQLLINGKDTQA